MTKGKSTGVSDRDWESSWLLKTLLNRTLRKLESGSAKFQREIKLKS